MESHVTQVYTDVEFAPRETRAQALRTGLVITVYFITVFAAAALISPWIYLAFQHFSAPQSLAGVPFHRYVNRSLLALALIGLWPLARAVRIHSWSQLGFGYGPARFREWCIGFSWGVLLLAIVAGASILAGERRWNFVHDPSEWSRHWRAAFLTALIVGFVEEMLFRGGLFGGLRKVSRFSTAALVSALVYAILHFFEKPPAPDAINWSAGFVTLGQMLAGFAEWQRLVPAFLNLAVLGLILARGYEGTGALFLSWGIHSGLIICAKTFPFITDPASDARAWVWGSDKLIDGWLSGGALILLYLIISVQFRTKRTHSAK